MWYGRRAGLGWSHVTPLCEQTDMTENITLPKTTLAGSSHCGSMHKCRAPLELKVWLQLWLLVKHFKNS